MQERPAGSHPPLQDVVIAAGGPVKGVARHCEHRVVHPELLPALIAPVLRVECGHVVLPVEARAPPGLHAHAVYGEAATRGLQTTGGAPTLASPHVDKARSAQSILWPRVSDSIAENIGRLPKNVFAHRPACSQATQRLAHGTHVRVPRWLIFTPATQGAYQARTPSLRHLHVDCLVCWAYCNDAVVRAWRPL